MPRSSKVKFWARERQVLTELSFCLFTVKYINFHQSSFLSYIGWVCWKESWKGWKQRRWLQTIFILIDWSSKMVSTSFAGCIFIRSNWLSVYFANTYLILTSKFDWIPLENLQNFSSTLMFILYVSLNKHASVFSA